MRGVGQVLLTVLIVTYRQDTTFHTSNSVKEWEGLGKYYLQFLLVTQKISSLFTLCTYLYTQYTVHIGNLSKHGLLCRAKNNNNIICFRFYLQLFTQHGRQYIDERCKKVHSRLGRFLLLSESVRRKYGFYNATLVVYTLFWCFVRKQPFFNCCLFNVETW